MPLRGQVRLTYHSHGFNVSQNHCNFDVFRREFRQIDTAMAEDDVSVDALLFGSDHHAWLRGAHSLVLLPGKALVKEGVQFSVIPLRVAL